MNNKEVRGRNNRSDGRPNERRTPASSSSIPSTTTAGSQPGRVTGAGRNPTGDGSTKRIMTEEEFRELNPRPDFSNVMPHRRPYLVVPTLPPPGRTFQRKNVTGPEKNSARAASTVRSNELFDGRKRGAALFGSGLKAPVQKRAREEESPANKASEIGDLPPLNSNVTTMDLSKAVERRLIFPPGSLEMLPKEYKTATHREIPSVPENPQERQAFMAAILEKTEEDKQAEADMRKRRLNKILNIYFGESDNFSMSDIHISHRAKMERKRLEQKIKFANESVARLQNTILDLHICEMDMNIKSINTATRLTGVLASMDQVFASIVYEAIEMEAVVAMTEIFDKDD